MKYETVKLLKNSDFKRLTGVHHSTFEKMLKVVQTSLRNFGRPPKLSRADQLLMTLMYWREYRTEFHIGIDYGVSEATVCRTIMKIEHVLLASGQFTLPSKRTLLEECSSEELVIIDATEQAIERPKKNKKNTIVERRSIIPKKLKY